MVLRVPSRVTWVMSLVIPRTDMDLPAVPTPSSKPLLDAQAAIHTIANAELIDDIGTAGRSISVQGITKDITHVTRHPRGNPQDHWYTGLPHALCIILYYC